MTTSAQWYAAACVLREHAIKLEDLAKREQKIEATLQTDEDAPRIVATVRKALEELEEAYANRQHGGVAQDQCLGKIRAAVQRP